MPKHTIRIATRKSPLALWQAHFVGKAIQQHWPEINYELIPLLTTGDRFLKDKLQAIGGKGLFVKELGMNFSDWRTRLKLLEAIKRLGEKQSIKEIAFDLGYETTSAFIFMFKKHLGTTPANYILEDQK